MENELKSTSLSEVTSRLEPFNNSFFLQDNTPLFIRFWAFKNLEGRLLTLVESMGLGEKQEQAVKGYMIREVWATIHEAYVMSKEAQNYLEEAFVIQGQGNVETVGIVPRA